VCLPLAVEVPEKPSGLSGDRAGVLLDVDARAGGSGIASPCSRITARWPVIASRITETHCSIVSPVAMHPMRSGDHAE
jgi:hypothetical protein